MDTKEILESLRVLVVSILKYWYFLFVGVVLAIVGAIKEVFQWSGFVPSILIWILAGVCFLVAMFLAFHDLRTKSHKQEWEFERKARIKQRATYLIPLKSVLGEMVRYLDILVTETDKRVTHIDPKAFRGLAEWLDRQKLESDKDAALVFRKLTGAMNSQGIGMRQTKQTNKGWLALDGEFQALRHQVSDRLLSTYVQDVLAYFDGVGHYRLYITYRGKFLWKTGVPIELAAQSEAVHSGIDVFLYDALAKTNKRIEELMTGS